MANLEGARGTVSIIDKATQPLRNIAKSFLNMGDASKKVNKDIGLLQGSINRIGRVQSNINRQTKDIAGQAVGVAALAMSLKSAVDPAIKFETAFAGVKKVASGPPEEIEGLRNTLIKMSKTMPNTAVELSNIAEAGAKMGFASKDLAKFTDTVAKASTAFDMSAEDAGGAFGKIASVLGYGMTQLEDYGDRVNYLADNLAADASGIIDITKRTAGAMSSLGLGTGDIAGLAAFADQMSVSSEIGASALNQIINAMRSTKKGSELFAKEGAKGILTYAESFKGLKGLKLAKAIEDTMGKGEGARMFEKMINQSDKLKIALDLGNETKAVGSMGREFAAMANTTENKLKVLGNIFNGIAISIGDNLLPHIKTMIDKLGPLSEKVGSFISANKEAIPVVGAIALALLGAKVAALAYTAGLWLLGPALTAMKVAMIAFNAVASLNPIGLVVIAVAALAAVAYTVYKNWEPITNFFKDLWAGLKNAFSSGLEFIQTYLGWTPLGMIINNWTPLIGFFKDLWKGIVDTVLFFSDIVSSIFNDIVNKIKTPFIALFEWFATKFAWLGDMVSNVMNVANKIGNIVGDGISNLGANIGEGLKNASSFFTMDGGFGKENVSPDDAMKQIQTNNSINNSANITVNVGGDKPPSVETSGDFKVNTFLNKGTQN